MVIWPGMAPWRVVDAVVAWERTVLQMSKTGLAVLCRTCSLSSTIGKSGRSCQLPCLSLVLPQWQVLVKGLTWLINCFQTKQLPPLPYNFHHISSNSVHLVMVNNSQDIIRVLHANNCEHIHLVRWSDIDKQYTYSPVCKKMYLLILCLVFIAFTNWSVNNKWVK